MTFGQVVGSELVVGNKCLSYPISDSVRKDFKDLTNHN